jgi:hypothetical protein
MATDGVLGVLRRPWRSQKIAISKFGAEAVGQLYIEPMTALPTVVNVEGRLAWSGPANGLAQCDGTVYRTLADRYYVRHTCLLVADMIDQNIFVADRALKVKSIEYVATTPESAGTLTMIVRRCQGTEAPASGDALMTAANMVGAALVTQTVYTATLTSTEAHLTLADGDRLAIDFTDDSAGELAGVCVTVVLENA